MPARLSNEAFREIERSLSQPLFMGVPVGPALNDALVVKLIDGHADWGRPERWRNLARAVRNRRWPQSTPQHPFPGLADRVLFTWEKSTPRLNELILPIVAELPSTKRTVLFSRPEVAQQVGAGIGAVSWTDFVHFSRMEWRQEYSRCRPEWNKRVKRVAAGLGLPNGAEEMLTLELLLASQRIAGCIETLRQETPALIVTEYDRNYLWSCLILAARKLGIPCITLQHGVTESVGFSPVLADKIVVWGEFDRDKLIAAGEDPGKIMIGGCPRLTRECAAGVDESRIKLGLDPDMPTILYATSPLVEYVPDVEMFCEAVDTAGRVAGLVRLHPSDPISNYESIRRRHPGVVFSENSAASLDECLAAANLVVVRSSGVGSDALIKRRPVVVMNPNASLAGHDRDLVEAAGCPHARSVADLVDIFREVSADDRSTPLSPEAEQYVARFCAFFGGEAAKRTAGLLKGALADPVMDPAEQEASPCS